MNTISNIKYYEACLITTFRLTWEYIQNNLEYIKLMNTRKIKHFENLKYKEFSRNIIKERLLQNYRKLQEIKNFKI